MDQKRSDTRQRVQSKVSFLKGFDQKIDGLKREAERLGRVVSNPKQNFSRSTLGGLYRIVNSILSAGPAHRIEAIGTWAERTNKRLLAMGKSGEKPSATDLEWLRHAISELTALRDTAMKELEVSAKNDDAKGAGPNDGGGSQDEKRDDTAKASDNADDEPFRERTSTIPLAIDDLSAVHQDDELPEHTSTIPLSIEDLRSVSAPPEDPRKVPPPVRPAGRPPATGNVWRTIAIAAIIGFALMIVFYLYTTQRPAGLTAPGAAGPTALPELKPSEPEKAETPPEAEKTAAEAENSATEKSGEPEDKADKEAPLPESPKSPEASQPKKAEEARPEAGPSEKKRREVPWTAGKAAAVAKPSPSPSPLGTLSVTAPIVPGASVIVLVDGMSRGKAPVKVKLPPGIHEVVFSANGKTSMRVVPIRADATKTIEAKVP